MPDFHLLLQDRVKGHFNGFPTPAMGLELLQRPTNVLQAMSHARSMTVFMMGGCCMIVRRNVTAKAQDVDISLVMKFLSDVFAYLIQVVSCILNLLKCSCMLHTQQPA